MSNMRIGGLASGMDIDSIVNDLMKAERMPLNKLNQEKQILEWQRDDYRDMNKQLFDLRNAAFDMKLLKTYNSKAVSSSNAGAVTASATANAGNGSFNIAVSQLATAAVNVSENAISADPANKIDPNATLDSQLAKFSGVVDLSDFTIETYDESGNAITPASPFTIDPSTDSLNDVLKKISDSNIGVRAFYDATADKVIMERTTSGNLNADNTRFLGNEIGFDATTAGFLANTLQINPAVEKGGTNAKFTYNGALEIETQQNHYTLNGITFNFHDTTTQPASISVSNDVESAFENIKSFVEKYNEVIETINDKLHEKRYRDYKPLTDEEEESLSEKKAEQWEERAKSGLIQRDPSLMSGLAQMRTDWYSTVDTGGAYSQLAEIGIKTSANYRERGKLIINEAELKQALTDNPESVYQLFANDGTGNQEGIVRRLTETIDNTIDKIETKAGRALQTNQTYTLGRQLLNVDKQIDRFEDRLIKIEDRYWRQFTAMEKAIQRSNEQAMMLMNSMGGF